MKVTVHHGGASGGVGEGATLRGSGAGQSGADPGWEGNAGAGASERAGGSSGEQLRSQGQGGVGSAGQGLSTAADPSAGGAASAPGLAGSVGPRKDRGVPAMQAARDEASVMAQAAQLFDMQPKRACMEFSDDRLKVAPKSQTGPVHPLLDNSEVNLRNPNYAHVAAGLFDISLATITGGESFGWGSP